MEPNLRISVITINLNNKEGLKKTISSVIGQTYLNIQYVVIDGASTDGSLDIIIANSDHIDFWVSQNDNGIYDAMNKGIKFSDGHYLIFLNSGDCFFSPESIELFVSQNDDFEIVYGDLEIIGLNTKSVKLYPSKLSFRYFLSDSLPHPGSFIKRSVFEKVGTYETNMLITSDWAFFIKAICLQNATYKHLPYIVSSFQYDGISSLPGNQGLVANEKMAFLENNFALFIDDYSEMEEIRRKYNYLKNLRLQKFLSFFFKKLHI